jgi:hypothetical protein
MTLNESDHVAINRGVLDESNHLCFVGGSPEEWEGFDFAAVARDLGELPDEPEPDAGAEELGSLMQ